MASGAPLSDIGARAGLVGAGFPVPDDDLRDVGGKEVGADESATHGELCAVAEECLVAEEGTVGGVRHARGVIEAGGEAFDPAWSARRDGDARELLDFEGKDDVHLGAAFEERLGEQDVRTARERSESEPDVATMQRRAYRIRDRRLFCARESAGFTDRCDHVAAVVDHGWYCEY